MSSLSRLKALTGPAIILMAALIAVGPLAWRGSSCGSDFGFHFVSWVDARHSISMGLLYPHWAPSPNFGLGEPRFVFYPPMSWMGGAFLGMLMPWDLARLVFLILILTATGLANRALAREALADVPATLAGCASIFLGFVLFSIYRRCDYAELMGGFWIPLLLLFALRRRNTSGTLWERALDGSAAPLALVVAGIWLSNGSVGIMASYLLAAVVLVSALIEESWAPVVRAAVSTCVGMGLASLYLIPAVWERDWVSIQYAVTPLTYMVENSWLFARHSDPNLAFHDMMLHRVSIIAVAMLAIAFGGGLIAWIRGVVPGERRWWLPLALIPPTVLLLLLPISQPIWIGMPELRQLQYSWRWLTVLEAPMALCFASAIWAGRRSLRIPLLAGCAALFVGISLAASHWWFVECRASIDTLQESLQNGIGGFGKPEYAPPGIRFPMVDTRLDLLTAPQDDTKVDSQGQSLPAACLLESLPKASASGKNGEASFDPAWNGQLDSCQSAGWRELLLAANPSQMDAAKSVPEKRWFTGVAEHAGYLILRLRYYPAWGVMVNGMPMTAMAERERGLMAVPVPRGNVRVSVDWTTTGDVVAARWVSAVALLLLIGLYGFEHRVLQDRFDTGSFVSAKGQRERAKKSSSKLPKNAKQKNERKPRRGGGM